MTKKRLEIFSHFFLFYIILKPPELSIQINSKRGKLVGVIKTLNEKDIEGNGKFSKKIYRKDK